MPPKSPKKAPAEPGRPRWSNPDLFAEIAKTLIEGQLSKQKLQAKN